MDMKDGNNSNSSGKRLGNPQSFRGVKYKRLPESDYITPQSDGRGRSDIVTFRALPSQLRMASEFISKGDFPFRTPSDFHRWCLHFGLHHLTSVAPPKISLFKFAQIEMEDMKDQLYMLEQSQTMDKIEVLVNMHVKEGNEFYALGIVMRFRNAALISIKDKIWRERTVRDVDQKFEALLKRREEISKVENDRVNLTQFMDPDDEDEEV